MKVLSQIFTFHAVAVCPQITAGCATLEPWAAIVTGLVAGALYLWASDFLIKVKIDDAVDGRSATSCRYRASAFNSLT